MQVSVPFDVCQGIIPEDVYKQACVSTTEEALASCQVVGYPAMIKASWGGGGKGIRKVHNDEEVKALFKQVQGEVPGSPIFIMKVATQVCGPSHPLIGKFYFWWSCYCFPSV
jgi:acetyl-CoA carboxylase/biotin carboxylase 1